MDWLFNRGKLKKIENGITEIIKTVEKWEADSAESLWDNSRSIDAENTSADAIAKQLIVPQLSNIRWGVYHKKTGKREKCELHNRLNYNICKKMTGYEFWSTIYTNLIDTNNAYAEIQKVGNRIISVNPLESKYMYVDTTGLYNKYRYSKTSTSYSHVNIWHLFTNSKDGRQGESYKKLDIYTVYAKTEELAREYMAHGGNPKRLFKSLKNFDSSQAEKMKEILRTMFDSRERNIILPDWVESQNENISSRDGQLLEQREYNRNELLFVQGIDPQNINIEKIYRIRIAPLLEYVSQSIKKYLLSDDERYKYNIRPVGTSRFMGDMETLVDIAGKLKKEEIATTNEIRETILTEMGLGKIKDGDRLQNPYTTSEKSREKNTGETQLNEGE